jgi:tripartite-type tricarboxylate transporter receptor subunit TctC
MLADPLGKALGQSATVDNKGGGNGVVAAMAVKRADPSGYTVLMQSSGYRVKTQPAPTSVTTEGSIRAALELC